MSPRTPAQVRDLLAPSEHDEQATLFASVALLVVRWPFLALMFAVPNFARISARYGARMAREGKKAGVPDTCLPAPRGRYFGLWLEMKKSNGSLADVTNAQREWIGELRAQGYATAVAFGAEDALRIVRAYCELGRFSPDALPSWPHPNTDFPPRRVRRKDAA